jgi:hypothetical protein
MKYLILILFFSSANFQIKAQIKKSIEKKIERKIIKDNGTIDTIETFEIIEFPEKNVKPSNIDESLSISKTIDNGVETTIYELTTIKNGEKKIIKWDGKGEMPAE